MKSFGRGTKKKLVALFALLLIVPAVGYAAHSSNLGSLKSAGFEVGDLRAMDGDGKEQRLGDLRGSKVVVFFYPRDETPGCTTEACAFRDQWARFEEAGVKVIGVSGGTASGKADFAKKQRLPFPLVTDEDLSWARAFGVRVLLGIPSRTSFLLDREGRISKVYENVDPGLHADEVLKDAAAIQ
jgi:peroxiredoxin Q/BCP